MDITIYNQEDKSLLEYKSSPMQPVEFPEIENHLKLDNKDYKFINSADIWITRTFGVG